MRYPHGLIGWIDLMTNDTGTAGQFYEALFGWSHTDVPGEPGQTRTHFHKDGALVAGMGHVMPGLPQTAAWTVYALVDDLDIACDAVTKAGGTVLHSAWHTLDGGRTALITDPTGAVLGLLQPGEIQGADAFNVPGAMTWAELQSRDLDAARPFYEDVFGWEWSEGPEGYWIADLPTKPGDDKSNAGAMMLPPDVPAGAPNAWFTYIAVDDCDKTLALAEQLSGTIFLAAMDTPPGRIGGITDPTGGMVLVLQYG